MPDSLRLALGTLTVLRVPPPRRVTPSVARGAMLLAPAVGLLLALVASVADVAVGDLAATRVLVAALVVLGVLTVVGHLALILSSSRLR